MDTKSYIILFVAGIILISFGLLMLKKYKYLVRNCTVIIKAEIYDYSSEIPSGDAYGMSYYPKIRYEVNGKEYVKELSEISQPPTVGSKINIKINPNNPSEMVADKNSMILGYAFTIAGFIMFAVMIYGFFQ